MAGLSAFLGSWREENKIGFDEMASALGLSAEKSKFFKDAKIEITYNKDGEDGMSIDVGFQGHPVKKTFRFKLGEPYDSSSIDDSPLKSKVIVEGDRLKESHTYESMDGMVMNIERYIDNGKMIVLTKVGDNEMKSTYAAL